MTVAYIKTFRTYADRDAYSIGADEIGNRWRVLEDGAIYKTTATGAGSANWTAVEASEEYIQFPLTLGTAGQRYVRAPFDGKVLAIYSVIDGALTTADEVLTPKIGGTAVTSGAITITQSSSAAGDLDSSTPSAANTFSEGDLLEVETDGGNASAVESMITWHCERT